MFPGRYCKSAPCGDSGIPPSGLPLYRPADCDVLAAQIGAVDLFIDTMTLRWPSDRRPGRCFGSGSLPLPVSVSSTTTFQVRRGRRRGRRRGGVAHGRSRRKSCPHGLVGTVSYVVCGLCRGLPPTGGSRRWATGRGPFDHRLAGRRSSGARSCGRSISCARTAAVGPHQRQRRRRRLGNLFGQRVPPSRSFSPA